MWIVNQKYYKYSKQNKQNPEVDDMFSPSKTAYTKIKLNADPSIALHKVIREKSSPSYTCCCLLSWMTPKEETDKIEAFALQVNVLMAERSHDESDKATGIVSLIQHKLNDKENAAYKKFLLAVTETKEYKTCSAIKNNRQVVTVAPAYTNVPGKIDAV